MFYRARRLASRICLRIAEEVSNLPAEIRETQRRQVISQLEEEAQARAEAARPPQPFISWFNDHGDKTHRLNYNLSNSSVVFDVGGYEGQWASDIFGRYCCNVHVFEPVGTFSSQIRERFEKNPKIHVYSFGLSSKNETLDISVEGDGSSTLKCSNNLQKIVLVDIAKFIKEQDIKTIDLMKVNIEGGEYDLLDHLIEADLIGSIVNLQIQFHSFVPDAEKRMCNIHRHLSKSHDLKYYYHFVWEGWTLK